ncbi:FIG00721781: hypothetical protein [hydrothermal vent metagenome]|uniref:ATP-grasp domain-containing protein n=1 Tax=hydrothermal vent metagenome TaxID=652676 RepID=A0A3B0R6N4_9ZZZZ
MLNANWLGELRLEKGGLRVKKTDALVRFDWGNLQAASRGLLSHILVQGLRLFNVLAPGRSYAIAFTPMIPAPWYLIWSTIHAGKGRITKNIAKADALYFFDDSTVSNHQFLQIDGPARPRLHINTNCTDISKAKVQRVFEQVFGYALAIDPSQFTGLAVEKSDENGAHDGRVVQCPCPRQPGKVYERLIVNTDNGNTVLDYRSPTVGGQVPLVYIKERPIKQRFANFNSKVRLVTPASIYSPQELQLLRQFTQQMGLDFGGLDVLRNREDGRIYVVDVNKTDMGPPTSLGFVDQLKSVRIMAKAFREFVILGRKDA